MYCRKVLHAYSQPRRPLIVWYNLSGDCGNNDPGLHTLRFHIQGDIEDKSRVFFHMGTVTRLGSEFRDFFTRLILLQTDTWFAVVDPSEAVEGWLRQFHLHKYCRCIYTLSTEEIVEQRIIEIRKPCNQLTSSQL
jgi:hypothetical protein